MAAKSTAGKSTANESTEDNTTVDKPTGGKTTGDKTTGEAAGSIPITGRTRAAKASPVEEPSALAPESVADAASARRESDPPNPRQQAASAPYTPEYDTPRRKPAEARSHAFNPVAWLVEGATGLLEEARYHDLGLSEDFWKHLYATRRESLLTARALIDSLLVQTEKEAQRAKARAERKQRRGSIPIQREETPE
jgi:hypothetical protein